MAANAYDFYSPFFAAAIVTKDGIRVPLFANTNSSAVTTDAGASSLAETGLESLPFLESLTIELNLAYLPKMTAVLSPPFRDAQKFIDSPLVEWGQSILEAQFGYSSGTPQGAVLSPPFQGLLLKPDIQIGAICTIGLNAQGMAGYSATVAEGHQTFKNKTRAYILAEVAKGSGTPLRDLEMDFTAVPAGSRASELLLNTPVDKDQGSLSDWAFLWQTVRDCGCWMSCTGNIVKVFERNTALAAKPKYTLRLFDFDKGKLGPIQGDFPILGVSSPTMAVFLPGATKALVSQGILSSTGETVTNVITDATTAGTKVGGGSTGIASNGNSPGPDTNTGKGGTAFTRDPSYPDTLDGAKEAYAASFSMGIKLEVDTLGLPDIYPGDVVAVKGVSARFDWNYGVFTVRHSLGPTGFVTHLTMMSNTSKILSNALGAQGAVNDNPPPPAEDQNKVKVEAKVQAPMLSSTFTPPKPFKLSDSTESLLGFTQFTGR